jgi:UPF0755 protein
MRRVLLVVVLLLTGAVVGLGLWVQGELERPLALPDDGLVVEVPSGGTLSALGRRLAAAEVLDHPRLLTLYARWRGDDARIRAGEYRLEPGLTPRTLLDKLVEGDVILHAVTIVEGWRFADMLRVIRAHPAVRDTDLDTEALMVELGEPGRPPEGLFFPDTYRFARGTRDVELLARAREAMRRELEAAWSMRDPDLPLETPYELLTLASIVEKETGLAAERPAIAGVFVRRLRIGMRLQTDPTVIYGLGDAFDGDLRRRDLVTDTPYNTYTRSGLPPTPIALPGRGALRGAARPEEGEALYFVATGRGDGSHRFSATLEEHNRAVADYLRALRSRADGDAP